MRASDAHGGGGDRRERETREAEAVLEGERAIEGNGRKEMGIGLLAARVQAGGVWARLMGQAGWRSKWPGALLGGAAGQGSLLSLLFTKNRK